MRAVKLFGMLSLVSTVIGFVPSVFAQALPDGRGSLDALIQSARQSPLFRYEFDSTQIRSRGLEKITLQSGVDMDFKAFVDSTSLPRAAQFQPLFRRDVQRRFLLATPKYKESIVRLEDRLLVDRHLQLRLKPGACDERNRPGILREICFDSKGGFISQNVRTGLENVRKQLRRVNPKAVYAGKRTVAQVLRLSDRDLLKLMVNGEQKEIRHISNISLRTYPLDLAEGIKLSNPLPYALAKTRKDLSGKTVKLAPQIATVILPDAGSGTRKVKRKEKRSKKRKTVVKLEVMIARLNSAQRDELACQRAAFQEEHNQPPTDSEVREMVSDIEQSSEHPCTTKSFAERLKGVLKKVAGAPWDFDKRYFLTGFTVGREISDKYEITFAPRTSLFGITITDRYFLRLSYYVGYGFGLRVPLLVEVHAGGTKQIGGGEGREFTVQVASGNGGPDLYRKVGLQSQYDFGGNEFVFLFKASAELEISIPGPDPPTVSVGGGKEYLEDFEPPGRGRSAPGPVNLADIWLEGEVTGLGLNAGIGGAFLDIGVSFDITNGRVGYHVSPVGNARLSGSNDRTVESDYNQKVSFDVIRQSPGRWGIQLDQPRYGFALVFTPEIRIRLALDLGIFETEGEVGPFKFDTLSLEKDFTLEHHPGTVVSHQFAR